MENNREFQERIADFIKGKLKGKAYDEMKAKIETDNTVALEYEMQLLERDSEDVLIEEDLKAKMGEWDQESEIDTGSGSNHGRRRWFWIIAILILLLSAFLLHWALKQGALPERQAVAIDTYLESEPDFSNVMGTSSPNESLLERARLATLASNYEEVIAILEKEKLDDDDRMVAEQLLGNAYFKAEKFEQALVPFQRIAGSKRVNVAQKGEWYLLLSYLSLYPEMTAEFDLQLSKIKEFGVDHLYYNKAIALEARIEARK